MMQGLANWRTSLLGALFALFAAWDLIEKVPETHDEWFRFAVLSGLAVLSFLVKDGATGSSPEPPKFVKSLGLFALPLFFLFAVPFSTTFQACSPQQRAVFLPPAPASPAQAVAAAKASAIIANNAFEASINSGAVSGSDALEIQSAYFVPLDLALREAERAQAAGTLKTASGLLDEVDRLLLLVQEVLRVRGIIQQE